MTSIRVALISLVCAAVPAVALAQVPVGTRVGATPVPSGYDDGGRPDPFLSLVVPKHPAPSAATIARIAKATAGLATLSVADAKVTGVVKYGSKWSAILEGPNHTAYVAHPQDKLLDGVVKSIDPLGVVLIEVASDGSGAVEGHEVRKTLHPAAEVIR